MSSEDGSSAKLQNPDKTVFLKMAAGAVRHINMQQDKNGLFYARKAMVMCALGLRPSNAWDERQLSQYLQGICAQYNSHFEGTVRETVASSST